MARLTAVRAAYSRSTEGQGVLAGTGTALNCVTVLAGASLGVALGDRLPGRTRSVVTDGLGLVTLLVAARQAAAVGDPALVRALGTTVVLVILGALVIGGVTGSLLRIEDRLAGLGGVLQRRFRAEGDRARFVEGFVSASLLFCVGPVTILGALQDGLNHNIELLALKSALDGFAALAFAAALGWGVAASVLVVASYQGSLTAVAYFSHGLLSPALVASITAVGGLLLVGVGLRLLDVRRVPVGDLLPALLAAPLLTWTVQSLR